jgi:hypothetical protein
VLIVLIEANTFILLPALKPDVLTMLPGFIAATVLWWRGMAIGTSELRPHDAEFRLQVGALLLVLIGVATLFNRSLDALVFITAFFFGALIAVPLTNLEMTHESEIGRAVPMTLGWWSWVLFSVLSVMLIGLVLVSILTGRSVQSLLALLISVLLFPVVLLISIIPVGVFDWLAELIRSIAARFGGLFDLGRSAPQQSLPESTGPQINLPAEVNFGIALLVFAIVVALVILLMRRADRLSFAPRKRDSDLEGALANAQESVVNDVAANRFSLAQLRRWLAAMTVRRLYARAAYEASRRGFRRSFAQTPYDFLPNLQRAFPSAEQDAQTLTDAYVAAHYGEVPDTDAALNALKASWERMRATPAPALTPDSRSPIG